MISHIQFLETILYVSDQEVSRTFYEGIFRRKADLHVPGMTEFNISEFCKLGLMPNNGIAKILVPHTPHPDSATGIPRCELYFYVDRVEVEHDNAVKCGAKLISPALSRNWGDTVCYFADPDGHILAFAKKNS